MWLICSYLDQQATTKRHVTTPAGVYHSDTPPGIRKEKPFVFGAPHLDRDKANKNSTKSKRC